MTDGVVDLARARQLFDAAGLAWVIDRLQVRLERGQPLGGRLRLADPDDDQRDALERLIGRRPGTARSISIEVAELERIVVHARIAPDLAALVAALRGPVVDRAALLEAEQVRWSKVYAELRDRVAEHHPWLPSWVDEVERTGLLRRLGRDPGSAAQLVGEVVSVLAALPADALPRSQLAATQLGDGHALDDDRPTTTLVLGAVEAMSGLPRRDRSAAERRALWARVGVLVDELSAPALVLGLRPAGDGLLASTLRAHAAAGEPVRVTLRQLVRHRVDWSSLDTVVSVCENPGVVAAAAARLGAGCAPLVCTEGQPSSAVQTLLRQLVEDGETVRFHTDLDVGGIRIGNLLVDRFGAQPWRMGRSDHLAAVEVAGGIALSGRPGEATWDPTLVPAMVQAGVAVHEESLVDQLLADLARP